MASSVTFLKVFECAGGDHLRISVTGDAISEIRTYLPDIAAAVTDEELEVWLRVSLKLAKKTRTANQMRTALNNGLVLTI